MDVFSKGQTLGVVSARGYPAAGREGLLRLRDVISYHLRKKRVA